MIILWLIAGLALPTVIGWLLIRILENKTPVLFGLERWVLGFLLGLTFTMFVTFVVHVTTGMALSRLGYLMVQGGLVVLLFIILRIRNPESGIRLVYDTNQESFTPNPISKQTDSGFRIPRWAVVPIAFLTLWTTLKILTAGATFLFMTPSLLDDVVDNWNFRGKVYFTEQQIQIELPNEDAEAEANPHSSYPPAVPLVKAQLATIKGEWSEGLVNGVHLFWYLSVLILLFYAIRRHANLIFALLGTYIITSLPLYMMHGTNPYSDVFLSAHVFVAIAMLFNAVASDDPDDRNKFFQISALATALLAFTKNEALLIHIPAMLLTLLVSLWWLKRSGRMQASKCIRIIIWYVVLSATVALPWMIFKWTNNLTFGNAQALSGMEIAWHSGVIKSILITTFLEGNWLLLFPLLITLLIYKRKIAFTTPLFVLVGFFLIIYLGQFPLYMFTHLYVEATRQTGYARGIIQLAPVIVLIVSLLLSKTFKSDD